MSTDFTGMIAFAQSLAETVKQAQTATEELAQVRKMLEDERRIHDKTEDERDDLEQECSTHVASITALRAELAASEAAKREVSEALARANAKLDSFRQLLGVDDGPTASLPTPAVLPEQPTNAIAELPHEAQPVDPAPAGGTGGVVEDHSAAVERYPAPMSYRDAGDPAGEPFKSEPTPAPEVAESRPTEPHTPSGLSGSTTDTVSADDRFGQAQEAAPAESWRDSASHVPYYRAFA